MSIEHIPPQKLADSLAASSAGAAGFAWLADVEPVITALAGIVAIVAGLTATWYHIEKATDAHRHNKEHREQERAEREAEDTE